MPAAGPRVFDVFDFEGDVIARSASGPVLVDFWAEWCRPCLALAPVLEALAEALGGELVVARVNVEAHPEIAARFEVSGLPDLRIFRDGAVAGRFTGAPSRMRLRAFVKAHCPRTPSGA
jgi:thioredoxin 1